MFMTKSILDVEQGLLASALLFILVIIGEISH